LPTAVNTSPQASLLPQLNCAPGEGEYSLFGNEYIRPITIVNVTGNYTIPAGTAHWSILVMTGTCTVNGATVQEGYSISAPPMGPARYGEIVVASVTGTLLIVWV